MEGKCVFCSGKSESISDGGTIISKDGVSAHQYCLVSHSNQLVPNMTLSPLLLSCSILLRDWRSEAMKRGEKVSVGFCLQTSSLKFVEVLCSNALCVMVEAPQWAALLRDVGAWDTTLAC